MAAQTCEYTKNTKLLKRVNWITSQLKKNKNNFLPTFVPSRPKEENFHYFDPVTPLVS